jgi:hypothetical protein
MKHSNFAMRRCFRLLVRRKQSDAGISFADKSWHPIPHAIMKPLESENVDVPLGGLFNVAHAHRDVINSFEFHEMLDRIYRILWIDKGGTRPRGALRQTQLCRLILAPSKFLPSSAHNDRKAARIRRLVRRLTENSARKIRNQWQIKTL